MNSIALRPIISAGKYPRMVSELGLTCISRPLESVTRIRSWEDSKIRRRSSISWLRACSVRLRSVMSVAVLDAPMILPDGVLIGEMLSETSTGRPSLRKRMVSWCLILLVGLSLFAAADPAQHVMRLCHPIGGNDEIDTLADGFRRGKSEQVLRR